MPELADNKKEQVARMKLPWRRRLPSQPITHPRTIQEFQTWPQLNSISARHLQYLQLCDQEFSRRWLKPWRYLFAVGPFVSVERAHESIPFVLFGSFRRIYSHSLEFSRLLSLVYAEFGILPDLYVYSVEMKAALEENRNTDWSRTLEVSIGWGREGIRGDG